MDAFASLVREFGPFIVVYWVAFHGGPSLLKQVGSIATLRFQTQDTIALRETDLTARLLDQTLVERDRHMASETAARETLQEFMQEFKEFATYARNEFSEIRKAILSKGDNS